MPRFAIIGDLVGSRGSASRARTQQAVLRALAATSALVPPVDRLEPTVGDEFQGVYATFGQASLATLVIRLLLSAEASAEVDARCGIGLGEREVLDGERSPMIQDGPAWWQARAALETLGRPAGRALRTWYVPDPGAGERAGPPAALANAFLTTRDGLVARLNERSGRLLLRSFHGESQREIAAAEGISESAVSQAFARGVRAVRDAQQMLIDLDRP